MLCLHTYDKKKHVTRYHTKTYDYYMSLSHLNEKSNIIVGLLYMN